MTDFTLMTFCGIDNRTLLNCKIQTVMVFPFSFRVEHRKSRCDKFVHETCKSQTSIGCPYAFDNDHTSTPYRKL